MLIKNFSYWREQQKEDVVEYFLNVGLVEAYEHFNNVFSPEEVYQICQAWIKEIDEGLEVKRIICNPR